MVEGHGKAPLKKLLAKPGERKLHADWAVKVFVFVPVMQGVQMPVAAVMARMMGE